VALADHFDGLLIDLDGVVWVGSELLAGTAEALAALLGAGKELVFLTNNPSRPGSAYAERLREAGLAVPDRRVLTAGTATTRLAAEALGRGTSALVIGAPAFRQSAVEAGLEVLDGAGARTADSVLVSGHRGFDYEELLSATLALQHGAELFATSRDPNLPMPGGAWPGTGAILAAVETASATTARIGGKPEPHLFEMARDSLAGAERVAMVGDRIASDIEGARRVGLETILVLSGATSQEQADRADPAPDHIIGGLSDLLR
jgi:HAD superfamily hydrolase (TIGR01450 family)